MNYRELGEWLAIARMDGRGLESYFGRNSAGGRGSVHMTIGRNAHRLATIELGARVTTSRQRTEGDR